MPVSCVCIELICDFSDLWVVPTQHIGKSVFDKTEITISKIGSVRSVQREHPNRKGKRMALHPLRNSQVYSNIEQMIKMARKQQKESVPKIIKRIALENSEGVNFGLGYSVFNIAVIWNQFSFVWDFQRKSNRDKSRKFLQHHFLWIK